MRNRDTNMAKARKASTRELNALDRFRRAQRVRLVDLAKRQGCAVAHLSRLLAGTSYASQNELRLLRAHVADLAHERMVSREGLEPSTPGLKVQTPTRGSSPGVRTASASRVNIQAK